MKKLYILCMLISLLSGSIQAQAKKVIRGVDGGMMVHSGYLSGEINPLNYKAAGAPLGIGGVIRLHLGEHWRIDSEGYVSTLSQMANGSYVKYGWGGLLGDFYWQFERLMPYIGLTLGGGALTDFLMTQGPDTEWAPVGEAYYNKQGFMAIDPFTFTLKTD